MHGWAFFPLFLFNIQWMVDDGPLSFWINDFVDTTCKKTDREICSHGSHSTLILDFQIQFFSEKRKYRKNYNKSRLLINSFGILLKNSNFWSSRNLWKINIFKNIFCSCPKKAIFKLINLKNHWFGVPFSPKYPMGILGGHKSTLIMSRLLI